MNLEHLRAFLWLRWRLSVNQWRRGGSLNAALMTILVISMVALAVPLLIGSFVLGLFVFPQATAVQLLYGADALIVGFLFFWAIGLLSDLQRSESLSLSKFLHLPVSVNGAFIINYVSSLLRLTLIVFAPMLLGFSLALAIARGPLLLTALPLTLAFLLMVTGLTYQFQGWLAALMSNPRRRRTVVVVTTGVFVLIFQLPNLIRFVGPWSVPSRTSQPSKLVEELTALDRSLKAAEVDAAEYQRRQAEILKRHQSAKEQADRETAEQARQAITLMNQVLPIGWLPLGVMRATEGNALPALLGTLAMTAIGAGCLWRAYRTTIALYRGQYTSKLRAPALAAPSAKVRTAPRSAGMLAAQLPGLSEPVSAIALGSLRSLIRSPESKMMLLTPVMLGAVFGSMVLRSPENAMDALRALFGIGAISMTLFGAVQLMANQFGFDRDGFRTYVLCAAPRRDILLGKNLAFVPLMAGMALLLLVILQVISPMRWDHFLAMAPQFVSMYLLFCIVMNMLSIFTPMHVAAGSLKPTSVKLVPVLLQLAMMLGLMPLAQSPTLFPLAIEALSESQGWTQRAPIFLVLALAMCAVVVVLYRFVLTWQGDLLRLREQMILDTVTNRAP